MSKESSPVTPTLFRSETATRIAWVTVALLWVAAFINALDRYIIVFLHDQIVSELHISDSQFGLLSSVLLWSYAGFCPLSSYFADEFGRRKAIIIYVIAWSGAIIWSGFSRSYDELFYSRLLVGIAEAGFFPAALALICDHHDERSRSRASAVFLSGSFIGVALTATGGYVAAIIGWRHCCITMGGLGLAYALFLQLTLAEAPGAVRRAVDKRDPESRVSLPQIRREVFAKASFWVFAFANTILPIGQTLLYFWLPIFLRDRFALSEKQATLPLVALLCLNVSISISSVVGGVWADKWSHTLPRSRMYVAGAGFCVAAPGFWILGHGATVEAFIVGVVIIGVGIGFYSANSMPILRLLVPANLSATAFGIATGFTSVLCGAITYLGGVLRDAKIDLSVAFNGIGLGVLGASILLFSLRPAKQRRES